MSSETKILPAGTYYIGDPCIPFTGDHDEWIQFLETFGYFQNDGCYSWHVGGYPTFQFACGGTKYGDGLYEDQLGRSYAVDAGMIACIPLDMAEIVDRKREGKFRLTHLGQIVTFNKPFKVDIYEGNFQFGDIEIETGDIEEDEESYYNEDCGYEEDEENEIVH